MEKCYLHDQVVKDLKNKMVFISGPLQVGKTTLALSLLTDEASYLLKWVHKLNGTASSTKP